MYWCGYQSEGRTHAWIRGDRGRSMAIRFVGRIDAENAGVSGPNVPNARPRDQPQFWPDRGVQIVELPENISPEKTSLPIDNSMTTS